MRKVSTRELAHRTKSVRELLEAGEPLAWTANGRVVAYLCPPHSSTPPDESPDWLSRAREAGAVNESSTSLSAMLYNDRG